LWTFEKLIWKYSSDLYKKKKKKKKTKKKKKKTQMRKSVPRRDRSAVTLR
jgi:hypothetical protein